MNLKNIPITQNKQINLFHHSVKCSRIPSGLLNETHWNSSGLVLKQNWIYKGSFCVYLHIFLNAHFFITILKLTCASLALLLSWKWNGKITIKSHWTCLFALQTFLQLMCYSWHWNILGKITMHREKYRQS